MSVFRRAAAALVVGLGAVMPAAAQAPPDGGLAAALTTIAPAPAGYRVGPIGLTATGRRIAALEPAVPVLATQPRIVLVGGLDGSPAGSTVVLDLLAWRLADRSLVRNRRRWQVAAVPCALPDRCDPVAGVAPAAAAAASAEPAARPVFPPEKGYYDAPELRETRYLWRWITMLAPDLVIEVRDGPTLEWRGNALGRERVPASLEAVAASLAGALGAGAPDGLAPVAALQVSGPAAEVTRAVRDFLDLRATRVALAPRSGPDLPAGAVAARPGAHARRPLPGHAGHELHPGAGVERCAPSVGASPAIRNTAIAPWRRWRRSSRAPSRPSPRRTC